MTRSMLSSLFSPKSIAIVGASRDKTKIGHIVLRNIKDGGYEGKIFPVNPSAKKIDGLEAFPNYEALPKVPDLAIIALPAALVLESVTAIGKKGTKNIIIFSAGFKEMGGEGAKLEEQLLALANKYKLTIVGPNCLGLVSPEAHLNATFGKVDLKPGNVRFISQSGAIATSIFDWAESAQIGLGEFITLGNKTVVGEDAVLRHWNEQTIKPITRKKQQNEGLSGYQPVGLYLESIVHGREFLRYAKEISKHDPVFLLKPGKSAGAQKAMMSHTGSLAGNDAVLNAALKDAGIMRCDGIEDVFDLTRAFAWENAPEGPNVAVVSNAGGPAVMSADLLVEAGLTLAPLSEKTHQALQKHLPRAAGIMNPVDVLGDALADRYAIALEAVLTDKAVDALVVILTPQMMTQVAETAKVIATLGKKHHKPIVCSFMGGRTIISGEVILNKYKLPSFRYPERAIKALGKMWWWQSWRTKQQKTMDKPKPVIGSAKIESELQARQKKGQTALTPIEANNLLEKIGLRIPPSFSCSKKIDAENFFKQQGAIVLKLASERVLHKSDAGGIITNIRTVDELSKAWDVLEKKVTDLKSAGDISATIQAQKQLTGGLEIIVGITTDATFGRVLMFGAGGVLVELVKDRNLHLLPLSRTAIEELVSSSLIFPMLKGYRGEQSFALEKLYDLIERLINAINEMPSIADVEINPIIITHEDAWAVDGRIILHTV